MSGQVPHAAPSAWVTRWSHLVREGTTLLDVACGAGRHVRWFAQRQVQVTALDRDASALEPLKAVAEVIVADIEAGPWPLPGRCFDAVIVTNYLWRPLAPTLIASLAPGGVLIYETFTDGQQDIGRPANPDFLLQPGELLALASGLDTVAYECGFAPEPARFVQRVVAVKPLVAADTRPRHMLAEPRRCAGG